MQREEMTHRCSHDSQNGDCHTCHLREKVTWYEKEAMSEEKKEGLFPEMNFDMDPQIDKSQ